MGSIKPTLHGSQLRGAKLSLEEKAALAHKYGYPAVDVGLAEIGGAEGGPQGVRDLLDRHGVKAHAAGGIVPADVFADDEKFAAAIIQAPINARTAAAAGATRTMMVLWSRALRPKEELWPMVVRRIRQIDDALEGTGVRLGMEFLGVRTLHPERPHAFVQSMAEANQLLDEAGARNVGLTLDSYHWYSAGDTLDTIRQTSGERIVLLHVNDAKDVPRDQLIDGDRLVPGEGVIPLAEWLRAIDSTGFDGFMGMEVLGPRLADASPDVAARIGMESIQAALQEAGLAARA